MVADQQVRRYVVGQKIEGLCFPDRLNQDMPAVGIYRLQVGDIRRIGFYNPASGGLVKDRQMPIAVKIAIQFFKYPPHPLVKMESHHENVP